MPTSNSNWLEGLPSHDSKVWYITDASNESMVNTPGIDERAKIATECGNVIVLQNRPSILQYRDLTHGLVAVVFATPELLRMHQSEVPEGVRSFSVQQGRQAA